VSNRSIISNGVGGHSVRLSRFPGSQPHRACPEATRRGTLAVWTEMPSQQRRLPRTPFGATAQGAVACNRTTVHSAASADQARSEISPPRKEATGQPSGTPRRARRSAPHPRHPSLWRVHRPGRGAASSGTDRRSERSTRSKATSVVGSRPTTAYSPSSDKTSSAVTMSPGRQMKPLERER
jgi:hypothetical protein